MTVKIFDSDSNNVIGSENLSAIENGQDVITGTTTLDASKFELWWPSGMGSQKLYNVTVDLLTTDDKTIASVNKRMGFRTIVLNMEPISDEDLAKGITNGSNCRYIQPHGPVNCC